MFDQIAELPPIAPSKPPDEFRVIRERVFLDCVHKCTLPGDSFPLNIFGKNICRTPIFPFAGRTFVLPFRHGLYTGTPFQKMPHVADAIHLDLDGAWDAEDFHFPTLPLRHLGPRLRYVARRRDVEALWRELEGKLRTVVVYGSGDFHHLAGMFIRRAGPQPVTLISFDNHPDWDIRPPYWSCGGWAARALRGGAERVSVWGCGNFELRFPSRLFADRAALKSGRLEIHPWAERQEASVCRRFNCMRRADWRARFEEFAKSLAGRRIYITVDMDCLSAEEAVTSWENGLFTAEDVAWAVALLRENARLVAGDFCGAWSKPEYERWAQAFAGKWDHPKLSAPQPQLAREINLRSARKILGALQ